MKKQDILENQAKIAYLAIGSNLGDKELNINNAKSKILEFGIDILKNSSSYETLSWPNPKHPKYVNIVLEIKTYFSPLKLLEICLIIERDLQRKRSKKNYPRTCDIDIIDYNKKKIILNAEQLIIPHPRMHLRNFVLLPLYEINKTWIHPIKKKNIKNLIKSLNIEDLRTIKHV